MRNRRGEPAPRRSSYHVGMPSPALIDVQAEDMLGVLADPSRLRLIVGVLAACESATSPVGAARS